MGGNCCEAYGTCARITVIIFTAAGLAFSILAAYSCEFIEFSGVPELNSGKAGLFQYIQQSSGECIKYPDQVDVGRTDNTARVCSALAALFGLIALVLILFEFCICKLCCARLIESCVYAVAYICQGLTFLIYNNGTFCTSVGADCSWSQGSTWSVLALCFYFISSCIMCCTPRSTPLFCKHREHKEEEKEAKKMAEEQEAKAKAAEEAEQDQSAAASSGSDDEEAAAHASAY